MQGSDAAATAGRRERQRKLGLWLKQEVAPRLEELIAVSYPLRKSTQAVDPVQQPAPEGEAAQPDVLGKGMVSMPCVMSACFVGIW